MYVGGGDTIFMMQIWKQYKLDEKLLEIYEKDFAVLTGISAGAICWFNCGYSDSGSFQEGNDWNYCWANGMLHLFIWPIVHTTMKKEGILLIKC
ncbi:MAG: Type 1 glutamine amidotransferase-like domain-containing protein [Mediterraneibacter gnavus]